jgi:hypothetical protein
MQLLPQPLQKETVSVITEPEFDQMINTAGCQGSAGESVYLVL